MKCKNCGKKTEVLQTFAQEDKVIRVRGHRKMGEALCCHRAYSIERWQDDQAEELLSSAKVYISQLARALDFFQHAQGGLDAVLERAGRDEEYI